MSLSLGNRKSISISNEQFGIFLMKNVFKYNLYLMFLFMSKKTVVQKKNAKWSIFSFSFKHVLDYRFLLFLWHRFVSAFSSIFKLKWSKVKRTQIQGTPLDKFVISGVCNIQESNNQNQTNRLLLLAVCYNRVCYNLVSLYSNKHLYFHF